MVSLSNSKWASAAGREEKKIIRDEVKGISSPSRAVVLNLGFFGDAT